MFVVFVWACYHGALLRIENRVDGAVPCRRRASPMQNSSKKIIFDRCSNDRRTAMALLALSRTCCIIVQSSITTTVLFLLWYYVSLFCWWLSLNHSLLHEYSILIRLARSCHTCRPVRVKEVYICQMSEYRSCLTGPVSPENVAVCSRLYRVPPPFLCRVLLIVQQPVQHRFTSDTLCLNSHPITQSYYCNVVTLRCFQPTERSQSCCCRPTKGVSATDKYSYY